MIFPKDLVQVDSKGRYSAYSIEYLNATQKHSWYQWMCSAGIQGIYINPAGELSRATCQVALPVGNIYDPNFKLPADFKNWIKCTQEFCYCGAEMCLSKVKDQNLVPATLQGFFEKLLHSEFLQEADHIQNPQIVFPATDQLVKRVGWTIDSTCNYRCSYCWPEVNSGVHRRTGQEFETAYHHLQTQWNLEKAPLKFIFTGGEPTINPHFLPFVKKLAKDKHQIHTSTNGSASAEYFEELIQYSMLSFSAHLEYLKGAKKEQFMDAIGKCLEQKKKNHALKWRWLAVHIMIKPGNLDATKSFFGEISQRYGHDKYLNAIRICPLHYLDDVAAPKNVDYSEEEREWIQASNL